MSDVQRLRDAVLADSLMNAAGEGSAILIAGNGHVRADRAVPWYLSRRVSQAPTVTVMLLEVEKGAKAPEDLMPAGPGDTAVAEAYYLLGVIEARSVDSWWVPQTELHLEAAIRTDPHGPYAEKAYAMLEEYVVMLKATTRIVRDELQKVKTLSEMQEENILED